MSYDLLLIIIVLILIWLFINHVNSKELDVKKKKQALVRQQEDEIKQKEEEAKKEQFERSKAEEKQLVTDTVEDLKNKLQKKYDKDLNGQIDLIETNLFWQTLQENQKKVQAQGAEYIKNFVKLEKHLKSRRETIRNQFKSMLEETNADLTVGYFFTENQAENERILWEVAQFIRENPDDWSETSISKSLNIAKDSAFGFCSKLSALDIIAGYNLSLVHKLIDNDSWDGDSYSVHTSKLLVHDLMEYRRQLVEDNWGRQVKALETELSAYTSLQYCAIHMLDALISEDLISFYELYETLDELQIWQSNYEKSTLKKLTSIDEGIWELSDQIQEFSSELNYALLDVTDKLKTQNDRLEKIHGSVVANNLLTAVNTYQLRKIGQNTKSLGA